MIETLSSNVFSGYSEVKTPYALDWEKEKCRSKEYREYRRKWVELPRTLTVPPFPLHLDVESSSMCNLRCPMCPRTIYVKRGMWRYNGNISAPLFRKIIDEGAAKGLCAVSLNSLGEPLLHPNIVEMVRYAKNAGILDVFFHTNATLLTPKLAEDLIKAGLDRIVISFDMPDRERYETIRAGAKYGQVIENMRSLKQIRDRRAAPLLIRVNMVKFPYLTQRDVEEMMRLDVADSIGLLDLVEYPEVAPQTSFNAGYQSKFICPQPLTRLKVFSDGTTAPCCGDVLGDMELGNVAEKTLEEMWNCEKIRNLRKLHCAGFFYKIPLCRACDWALKEDKHLK